MRFSLWCIGHAVLEHGSASRSCQVGLPCLFVASQESVKTLTFGFRIVLFVGFLCTAFCLLSPCNWCSAPYIANVILGMSAAGLQPNIHWTCNFRTFFHAKSDKAYLDMPFGICFGHIDEEARFRVDARHILDMPVQSFSVAGLPPNNFRHAVLYTPSTSWTCRFGALFRLRIDAKHASDMTSWTFSFGAFIRIKVDTKRTCRFFGFFPFQGWQQAHIGHVALEFSISGWTPTIFWTCCVWMNSLWCSMDTGPSSNMPFQN